MLEFSTINCFIQFRILVYRYPRTVDMFSLSKSIELLISILASHRLLFLAAVQIRPLTGSVRTSLSLVVFEMAGFSRLLNLSAPCKGFNPTSLIFSFKKREKMNPLYQICCEQSLGFAYDLWKR